MTKSILAMLIATAGTAAMAAEPLGTLSDVSGPVSVGGQGFVARAASGTPLQDGASIMVPSGAKATVQLSEGCIIHLKESQHLTLNNKLTCGQMQASVKNLFKSYAVAQAPLTPVVAPTDPAPVGFQWTPVLSIGGVVAGFQLIRIGGAGGSPD